QLSRPHGLPAPHYTWAQLRLACRSSAAALTLRESAPQHLREDDRVVVFRVMGGVDERQRAIARPASERGEPWTLAAKLLDVASAKLLKAAWLVPQPPAQICARG